MNTNEFPSIEPLAKSKLESLEFLDLDLSYIEDYIPLQNSIFKYLKELYLSTTIIDLLLFEKVPFSNLEILDLSLHFINVNDEPVFGIDLNGLKNCNFPKLKKLILNHNNISDISALENVKFGKLEELYLNSNKIQKID